MWALADGHDTVAESNESNNYRSVTVTVSAGSTQQTITFDDLPNPNRPLNGQYPSGTIDWGRGAWYLSGPFGQFTTQSIGFNGAGPTSAALSFVSPKQLVQVDAFNGGSAASTVTLGCPGRRRAASRWRRVSGSRSARAGRARARA